MKLFRRNQNYLDILRQLSLGDKQLNSFDISLRFTHLFWFGDLNYRLDMDIQVNAPTHKYTIFIYYSSLLHPKITGNDGVAIFLANI